MQTLQDWLDYWGQNIDAASKGHKKMAILVAVVLAILSFVGLPFTGEVTARVLLLVFGAWCLLWVPFYRWKKLRDEASTKELGLQQEIAGFKERERPKLRVLFAKNIPGCSVPNNNGYQYFRLQITLDCHQAVSGCFGTLTCIQREPDNAVLVAHETYALPFSPSEESDATDKTLRPHVPYFMDLLVISYDVQRIMVAKKGGQMTVPLIDQNTRAFDGIQPYILTVKLGGHGISTQTVRLRFDWKGNHATADFSVVD